MPKFTRLQMRDTNSKTKNVSFSHEIKEPKEGAESKSYVKSNESDDDWVTDCEDDEGSSNSKDSKERMKEKLLDALSRISEKSSQERVSGLQKLCDIFTYSYLPELVERYKDTVLGCIERLLRRGSALEKENAANLAPLLMLQTGADENMLQTVNPILRSLILDETAEHKVRTKCCTVLGLLYFLAENDPRELSEIMHFFEQIFGGSFLKEDGQPLGAISEETAAIHAEALTVWTLLLTALPADYVLKLSTEDALMPSMDQLISLLNSPYFVIRLIAGESIAVVLECGREHEKQFGDEYVNDLKYICKMSIKGTRKHDNKKALIAQNVLFKDLLRYLENNEMPKTKIPDPASPKTFNSWVVRHQYTSICVFVGGGLTVHLRDNNFLRSVFKLAPKVFKGPQPDYDLMKKIKAIKRSEQTAASKQRTRIRTENRANRFADFEQED